MDTRIGEVRRIHVVYILSRGGHLEHPHLIKVHPVVRNGVRLRDVKRWLSNLRGKDMPNSFSWSYKRRYKSGYLWQDLCDDDLITPICDNEYVLKGSQISPTCQDTCTCGGKAPAVQKGLQNKNGLKELAAPNVLLLELDSSEGRKNYEQNYNNSDVESCKEMHSLKSNDDITLRYDEIHEVGEVDTIECAAKTSGNTPSKVFNGSGDDEAVKVYKAIRNLSNVRLDAATQTGESTRCSDKEETLPLLGVIADAVSPKPVTAKKKTVGKMISSKVMPEDRKFTSKFTCMGNDVVSQPGCNSENIIKSATKESRQAKAKSSTTASHVLRQLFSCGGIDTRDGGIHNVKALEFNRSAIDEGFAGTAVSLASTPSKKLESQTNSTIFGRFSELLSANNLSVTNSGQSDVNVSKKSEGSLERQSSFVEAVANTAGDQKLFEELHLPLTSSGEYSSEKSIVDIPSPYGNSYSRVQFSGSPRVPPINIYGVNATKTTPKASTPSKKIQKGSLSPAGHLDDLSYWSATFPSSPRDDSRSSRKIKTPKGNISGSSPTAKHNLESYCLQCGRAVKPEYLNAHTRYCRDQRNGKIDAKARTIMAKQSALGVQGEFAESYDRFPHSVAGHVVMPHSLF